MTIDLACPGCGKSYNLPESQIGKRARCKRCGEEFRIDRPEPELVIPEPPKLAYLEPSISLAKPPPPPMMPPPPRPTLRPAQEVVVPRKPASPRPLMPDSLPVECPFCRHRYDVDAALAGKRARCKSCREVFRLPEAAAVVPTPPVPVASIATAPPQEPDPPKRTLSIPSLPPGGLGPLRVGLVAVGACVAVIAIGALIRVITRGEAPEAHPAGDRPAIAVRPGGGVQPTPGFDPFASGMAEAPASVPCVDVLCPDYDDPDGLVGEAIRARLEGMTDSAPPEVFRFRSADGGGRGRVGTGIRLGPVADPQAFARKIRFGTVASVEGRKITVVAVRAEPADLAEARAARSGRPGP